MNVNLSDAFSKLNDNNTCLMHSQMRLKYFFFLHFCGR